MSIRRIRAFYALLDRVQGRRVVPRLDAALARHSFTAAQLRRHADERLCELLAWAAREVPFYAERLGRVASDPEVLSRDAFTAVPPLEKAELAEDPERLLPRGRSASGAGVTAVTSGGTTGPPTRILLDAETVDAHTAASLRSFLWWDADPTRRHAMLWGPPEEENTYLTLAGRLRGAVLGRVMMSTRGMDAEKARRFWLQLCARRFDHVAGYSSALVQVARAAAPNEVPRIAAGVAAAAEPLFDFQREIVERAFAAPVRDRYGSNEFALIAHHCRQGGLHVATDRVRLDLVGEDGSPVPAGEVGRVLVTDLDNYASPLIRYRIGDLAAWGPNCACGLPFPTLIRVFGRERDALAGDGGRLLTPHDFAAALIGSPAYGLQIVADERRRPREVHLESEPFPVDAPLEQWRKLAGQADLRVRFVGEVRRSRSGKILPVLSDGS